MSTEDVAPHHAAADRSGPLVVHEPLAFGKRCELRLVKRLALNEAGGRLIIDEGFIDRVSARRHDHAPERAELDGLDELRGKLEVFARSERIVEGAVRFGVGGLRRVVGRRDALHLVEAIPLDERFGLAEVVFAFMTRRKVVLVVPLAGLDGELRGVHRTALEAREVAVDPEGVGIVGRHREARTCVFRIAFRRGVRRERIARRHDFRFAPGVVAASKSQRHHVLHDRHADIEARAAVIGPFVVLLELAFNREGARKVVRVLFGDDVHHAAHGVRTPDERGRAAKHFNAVDHPGRRHEDRRRIETVVDHGVARILAAAVCHDERVGGAEPADRDGRIAHLRRADFNARHIADRRTDVGHGLRRKLFGRRHRHARGRPADVLLVARGGHDRGFKSVPLRVVRRGGEDRGDRRGKRQQRESAQRVVHFF